MIEDFVRGYINENVVERALLRRINVNRVVRRTEEQLAMLESEYSTRNETLKQANDSYMQALEMVNSAINNLVTAEEAFNNASEELRMAEAALDSVCSENSCEDIPFLVEECTTCFVNTYINTVVPCTMLGPMVRTCGPVRIQPNIRRRVWEYRTICSTWCGFACFFLCIPFCSTRCRGVCVSTIVEQPNLVEMCFYTQREVLSNCPGRSVSGRTSTICCEDVTRLTEDTQCKEECRNGRMMAIRGLQQSRQDLAAPFEGLENARAVYATARSSLTRETLHRDNVREMRDQLDPPIESTKRARELSVQNQMRVLSELEQELRLAEQVGGNQGPGSGNSMFNIITATFNVTIDSRSPTQVPVKILYESRALQLTREIVVNFDFASSQEINLRKITEVIVQDFLNTTAPIVKRSADRYRRQANENQDFDILKKSNNEKLSLKKTV